MMKRNAKLTLAGSAIAAILAITPTPLAAQEEAGLDPPSTTTSTSDVPAAATPAVDPLAPVEEPVEATIAAAPQPVADAAPAPKPKAKASSRRPVASTAKPAPVRAAAPAIAAPPAVEPAEIAAETAAVAAVPPPAIEAPPAVPAAEGPSAGLSEELALAAGAGLAALGLAGVALVSRRRRRSAEHEVVDEQVWTEPVMPRPTQPDPAPVVAPLAAAAPRPAVAGVRPFEAPAGASPRVRAAYQGPSDENPFLSLKKRLKRARALDQMDKHNGVPEVRTQPRAADNKVLEPLFRFNLQPASKPAFQY